MSVALMSGPSLAWLAYGLRLLAKHRTVGNEPALVLDSDEEDIAEEYPALRQLAEKEIKRHGYIWRFNKTDTDHWPSLLHGHDYGKNLKLDVVTGKIYDVATKQCCKRLASKKLAVIQEELRKSPDFAERVVMLLGS